MSSSLNLLSSVPLADLRQLVTRISTKAPALTSRAQKAALILLEGRIRCTSPTTFAVLGTAPEPYAICATNHTCSCPDFTHRAPEFKGKKWCGHLLAVAMLHTLAIRDPEQPAAGPGRPRPERLMVYRRPLSTRPRPRVPLVASLSDRRRRAGLLLARAFRV